MSCLVSSVKITENNFPEAYGPVGWLCFPEISPPRFQFHIRPTGLKFLCKGSPIPLAARAKAWVFALSLVGIVGSNPAGVMDVCLL